MIHNATFLCFSSFDHPRKISSKLPRKNPSASSTSLRNISVSSRLKISPPAPCLPLPLRKVPPPFLQISSFFSFFFCSCLPQQASRCFLPSAALLCPSQPPISCLKAAHSRAVQKNSKENNKRKSPPPAPWGGGSTMVQLNFMFKNYILKILY